jgi:hypothetical protein
MFIGALRDLEAMEAITEAKIQATLNRQADVLVKLLQEQIDPLERLGTLTLEIGTLSGSQQEELSTHIARWAQREQHLKDLLEKNLGYIGYLKQLLGINGPDQPQLNLGL